jgi:predicted phosphodiesterase
MSVDKRLTEVFRSSQEIPFDDGSKFILFSDCHRGDNSWADDFAGNQNLFFFALQHYFDNGFTYIEIGDGDELYENKRFSIIREAHSNVFWLMREFYNKGRFIMIHGNHDMERSDPMVVAKTLNRYSDHGRAKGKEEPLFEGIRVHGGLVLKHDPTGGKIFLAHGHQGDGINDRRWKFGRFWVRYIWKPFQLFGFNDPTRPAKNYRRRSKLEEKIQAWVEKNHQPAIFGHTHRPYFASEGQPPYFNDGSCVHPRCITGIEIDRGNIQLIKWWLCPDKTGRLCVTREILEGPRKVASLFE